MPSMGCYSSCWRRDTLLRQDNRPAGRSRIGRGFHPKKVR